ncbi:MAG TPA: hypothetical protein VM307_15245 [Egibacteraceae bacterium]|nr:hypothetical protein [Egibacteraceae bacterium]
MADARFRLRVLALLTVVAVAGGVAVPGTAQDAPAPTAASTPRRLDLYRGLGSWTDIYDVVTYEQPVAAIARMHDKGVRTVYIETANYRINRKIFRPKKVARMIHAAHRRGMKVVAWYLPGFDDLDRDYRRAMAAIRFTTPRGHRFDAFALDIEATVVRDISVRNRRMRVLSRRLREAVGRRYPLGAIVPEAGALYWPDFPYATVDRYYDVFLPMAYFTFRTSGPEGVRRFTRRNIRAIRRATGDPDVPIHIIGGVAGDASPREVAAFVGATLDAAPLGASLYEFETTTDAQWRRLAPLNRLTATGTR